MFSFNLDHEIKFMAAGSGGLIIKSAQMASFIGLDWVSHSESRASLNSLSVKEIKVKISLFLFQLHHREHICQLKKLPSLC